MLKSDGLIQKGFQLLKKPTFIQFFKFGIVGVCGFLIDTLFTYTGIYALGMDRIPAGLFAFPFAVTFTWLGNRFFTFREIDHEPMAKQLGKFAAVCGIGIVFNRGTYSLLVSTIPLVYTHPILGLMAGSIAAMFFNFFASRKLVFKS